MNKKILSLILFLCVIFGLCFTSCEFGLIKNQQESTTVTTYADDSTSNKANSKQTETKSKRTVIVYITQSTSETVKTHTTKKPIKNAKKPSTTIPTTIEIATIKKTSENKPDDKTSNNGNTGYTDSDGVWWSPTY